MAAKAGRRMFWRQAKYFKFPLTAQICWLTMCRMIPNGIMTSEKGKCQLANSLAYYFYLSLKKYFIHDKEKKNMIKFIKSKVLLQLIFILIIFLVIYFIFATDIIYKNIGLHPFDNYPTTFLILLICTTIIGMHLVRIKLIFWRIFLQTFLSTESKVYAFFSHGYLVRVMAFALALGCALKIFIFMGLTNVHKEQFIALTIGFLIFWLFRYHNLYGTTTSTIRYDVGLILKSYLTPFLIATAIGMGISLWEIYHIEELPMIHSLSDAMELSLMRVDPQNNIYVRPLRVLMRHIYTYELAVQQVVHIPVLGQAVYFIYLVISEGSVTFFGIFLLGLPINLRSRNA